MKENAQFFSIRKFSASQNWTDLIWKIRAVFKLFLFELALRLHVDKVARLSKKKIEKFLAFFEKNRGKKNKIHQ